VQGCASGTSSAVHHGPANGTRDARVLGLAPALYQCIKMTDDVVAWGCGVLLVESGGVDELWGKSK
jgi:hypothetical protein